MLDDSKLMVTFLCKRSWSSQTKTMRKQASMTRSLKFRASVLKKWEGFKGANLRIVRPHYQVPLWTVRASNLTHRASTVSVESEEGHGSCQLLLRRWSYHVVKRQHSESLLQFYLRTSQLQQSRLAHFLWTVASTNFRSCRWARTFLNLKYRMPAATNFKCKHSHRRSPLCHLLMGRTALLVVKWKIIQTWASSRSGKVAALGKWRLRKSSRILFQWTAQVCSKDKPQPLGSHLALHHLTDDSILWDCVPVVDRGLTRLNRPSNPAIMPEGWTFHPFRKNTHSCQLQLPKSLPGMIFNSASLRLRSVFSKSSIINICLSK